MSLRWARLTETGEITAEGVFAEALDAGFDAVHLPISGIADLDDARFTAVRERLASSRLRAEVCSSLLPAGVQVSGQGFNLYVWAEYLRKAAQRVAELGCRQVVWNDGRARIMPLEESLDGLKEQVMQFLYVTSEILAPLGMALLVEPLSPRRTNFLNTIEETEMFVDSVGRDNILASVSLRDLEAIGLPVESLGRWKEFIGHIHMENPATSDFVRTAPSPADPYDYGAFLSALRKIGYDGIVTLPADAGAATLQFCRSL